MTKKINKIKTNTVNIDDKRARELASEIEKNNLQALDSVSQALKIDKLMPYEELEKKQKLIYEGSLTSEQLHYVNTKLLECINARNINDMDVFFNTDLGFSPAQIKVLYWLLRDSGFPCEKTEYHSGDDVVATVDVSLRNLILLALDGEY